MSILSGVRDFIASCPYLKDSSAIHIDRTEDTPVSYAVLPKGEQTLAQYLDGSAKMQYAFLLQVRELTETDVQRLENNAFFEAFSGWLSQQAQSKLFPSIGLDKIPTGLACENAALLADGAAEGNGVYQIECRLYYTQAVG